MTTLETDVAPRSIAAGRPRKTKVYFAAGPGSLIDAYTHWKEGVDLPREMSVTYSGQFFTACRNLGIEAIATASSPAYEKAEELRDGGFTIRQRPAPWERWNGPKAHLGEIYGNLRHVVSALKGGANVVILQGGYQHWYVYALLRLFGVRLVPVLMVVLWLKYGPSKWRRRRLWKVNGRFFRHCAFEVISMSGDCSRQLLECCGVPAPPIRAFVPKYRREQFREIVPKATSTPFRVLYVGRLERSKGVFDLLEVARRFASEGREDIAFDLCGTGSVVDELRRLAEAEGLAPRFRIHGHCNQSTLRDMYASSHVVVVPTRMEFVEGFNQVVVEAVISGTPVITSGVCPSLELVAEAAVEVTPDDPRAYGDAILRCRDDPAFYESRRSACSSLRAMFLSSDLTFDRVMEDLLGRISGARRPID